MKPATLAVALVSGVIFGFGLAYSSMVKPEAILAFLAFQDLGLLFVLGGAAAVTGIAYYTLPRVLAKPWFGIAFGKHPSELTRQTIGGAALFGVGWGLSGVCPGPAIAGLGVGNWPLLIALVGMFLGAYAQGFVASKTSSRGA